MEIKMVSRKRAIIGGICGAAACSVITGVAVCFVVGGSVSEELKPIVDDLKEVQSIVDKKFVGDYDMEDVENYVMTGYISGLGDRWSYYMSPDSYQEYLEDAQDTRIGIGVTVKALYEDKKDSSKCTSLEVQTVQTGSPADEAGFGSYDRIVAVEGKDIADYDSFDDAVDTVRGDAGTDVTLTVEDYGTGKTEDKTITRAEFEQIYVNSHMIDDDTAYVQITEFASKTDEQFIETMDELKADGVKNVIFDMRNDPGGSLTSLVNTLDYLLPEGDIITLKDKNGDLIEQYTSDAECCDMNMAVMVNEDTYSAAEFFAEALREYDLAPIIGEKTVGKGYAQIVYPLSNGGAVGLSSECYYTPNGDSLIGVGVTPDVEVSLTKKQLEHFYTLSDEDDSQIQAALKALNKE